MYTNNEDKLRSLFANCSTPELIYEKLLTLGRLQKPLAENLKTEKNLVKGCQSRLYLHSWCENDLFFFETEGDALISSGLAQALVLLYSGLSAKEILTHKPTVLEGLGIIKSLSPSRSNGLASLDLKMRQDVLKLVSN